jgi:hypothetical protein
MVENPMRASFRLKTVLMLCLTFATTTVARAGSIESVWIDAEHHPLDDALRAVLMLPEGASAEHPVPGCLVVHGSGGLFKENAPGEDCGPDLENNFRELGELLVGQGVAALLPSSFVSRDPRFCEDNDDAYFQFVTPPFHNEGDGDIARDGFYKMRRTACLGSCSLQSSRSAARQSTLLALTTEAPPSAGLRRFSGWRRENEDTQHLVPT